MMKDEGWKKTIGNLHRSAAAFIKWVMLGSAVGSIVGVMGVLFHFSVEWATEMRQQHSWLLFLLPLGGVVIALLYRQTGMEKDMGTNTILEAVRGEHPLRAAHRTADLCQHGHHPPVRRLVRQRGCGAADRRQHGRAAGRLDQPGPEGTPDDDYVRHEQLLCGTVRHPAHRHHLCHRGHQRRRDVLCGRCCPASPGR